MKFGTLLIGTCLILKTAFLLCGCGNPYPYKEDDKYVMWGQKIAMPKEYRQITGYDSIQVVHYSKGSPLGNGWEGHFCYPNEWEFEKFKKIKVDSIVFHYDSILVLHYNNSEVK